MFGSYRDVVKTPEGTPVSSASVTVYVNGTDTLATIYATPTGGSKSNPFDTDSTGVLEFFAPVGTYSITVDKPGSRTAVVNGLDIMGATYLTPAISITFADIEALRIGGGLSAEQHYLITDFNALVMADSSSSYLPVSGCNATIDITGLSTLDLTGYGWANNIQLTSTNLNETITSIVNYPTTFEFRLFPESGLILTNRVGGRGDIVLSGNMGEACTMLWDSRVSGLRMSQVGIYTA